MFPNNGMPFKIGVYNNKSGTLNTTIRKALLLMQYDKIVAIKNDIKAIILN